VNTGLQHSLVLPVFYSPVNEIGSREQWNSVQRVFDSVEKPFETPFREADTPSSRMP
jgi:hypothetical protein